MTSQQLATRAATLLANAAALANEGMPAEQMAAEARRMRGVAVRMAAREAREQLRWQ